MGVSIITTNKNGKENGEFANFGYSAFIWIKKSLAELAGIDIVPEEGLAYHYYWERGEDNPKNPLKLSVNEQNALWRFVALSDDYEDIVSHKDVIILNKIFKPLHTKYHDPYFQEMKKAFDYATKQRYKVQWI